MILYWTGEKSIHQIIDERLDQARKWIKKVDYPNDWSISPPALSDIKQRNWWDCGVFAIHLTYLAAKEKMSYAAINQLSFLEMRKQIRARRNDMVDYINNLLTKNENYKFLRAYYN